MCQSWASVGAEIVGCPKIHKPWSPKETGLWTPAWGRTWTITALAGGEEMGGGEGAGGPVAGTAGDSGEHGFMSLRVSGGGEGEERAQRYSPTLD